MSQMLNDSAVVSDQVTMHPLHSGWGPLVSEVDVDVAVVKTLRLWLPHYLARVEQERGLANGLLARPKPESYANTINDDEFVEHQLPAMIATTAVMDDVGKAGDGMHFAEFRCRVSVICRGTTPPETRAVTALFSACVKRVMVQQASLGGFAAGVRLVGGNLMAVPDITDQGRYLAAGMNDFSVSVDEVVQSGVGPFAPPNPEDNPYPPPDPNDPDTPYDPVSTVGDVTVSVTDKES